MYCNYYRLTYLYVPDNSLKVEVGATYDYVDNDQEIPPLNSSVAGETLHQDSIPYHSMGPEILQTGIYTDFRVNNQQAAWINRKPIHSMCL